MARRRRVSLLACFAAIGALAAGCGGSGTDASAEPQTVLVLAASSLSDAFARLDTDFEATHPEIDVQISLAGSSRLREQLLAGAPADVFASASVAVMEEVDAAGLLEGAPVVFARNRLMIAVPAGNPAGVSGLADFADPDLLLGLCADGVPCGTFARQVLTAAGVDWNVDTEEPDVRALLTKIEAGELDAGIVYVTDVRAAGAAVEGIEIGDADNVDAPYPIAVLADSASSDAAAQFVAFVASDAGRAVLVDAGFAVP